MAGSRMAGHIVLTGRAKDTIVLTSGKNIEPQVGLLRVHWHHACFIT